MFEIVVYLAIAAAVIGFLTIVALIAYRRAWRIPQPNEALIIVGKRKGGPAAVSADDVKENAVEAISKEITEGLDFRISTAATWVNPVTSRVFRLPLDSRSTDFEVECHDNQKIAVRVKGVILYKVGDNYPAMAAAARRFLQMDEATLNQNIRDLVTGQVRALVGGMTIPEMITDRQKLIDNVREATHEDMARLGLSIDSLSIQDLSDDNEYIRDLGRPQAEAVAREASVAADAARTERERAKQTADLEIAKVRRDTEVEAAVFQAEEDRAREEASQAGPLARATAERGVVARQAEVAGARAEVAERVYDAEVKKRADADRYRVEQEAEADRARRMAIAEAEAEAIRRRGEAEAAGLRAKGEALSKHGRLVIDERIAERMPEIAAEIARPLGAIDRMLVLDGPEGLTKSVVGAVAQAGDALAEIRGLVPDNPHEGPSHPGGGEDDGGGDPGPGSTGPAAPPLDDLVPDPDEPAPSLPGDDAESGDEADSENGVEDRVSGALGVLRERFEGFDAEDAPDYSRILADSETDDQLAAAIGEVARDPQAVEQLLGKSGLSARSQQVAGDLLASFTGSGETKE
jgi:flotillin